MTDRRRRTYAVLMSEELDDIKVKVLRLVYVVLVIALAIAALAVVDRIQG